MFNMLTIAPRRFSLRGVFHCPAEASGIEASAIGPWSIPPGSIPGEGITAAVTSASGNSRRDTIPSIHHMEVTVHVYTGEHRRVSHRYRSGHRHRPDTGLRIIVEQASRRGPGIPGSPSFQTLRTRQCLVSSN